MIFQLFKFANKQDILIGMRFLSFLLTIFYLFIFPNLVAFVLLPFWVFLPVFIIITGVYLSAMLAPSWVYVILMNAKRVNLESSMVGSEMRKVLRGKMTYPYLYQCSTGLQGKEIIVWGKKRDYFIVCEKFFELSSGEMREKIENLLTVVGKPAFYFDSTLQSLNLILMSILRLKYRWAKKIFRSEELAFGLVMLIYFIYLPFFYMSEGLLSADDEIFSLDKLGKIDRNLLNIESKVIS